MIRILGITFATALTTVSAAGILAIIAADFLGMDGVISLWQLALGGAPQKVSQANSAAGAGEFKPEKEIHFFEQVPVDGTDLVVLTGAAYASVADVESKRPLRQWCYINIALGSPSIHGRIDLGSQTGNDKPVYTPREGLAAADLKGHGLDADRLVLLARTHCRFGKLDPVV